MNFKRFFNQTNNHRAGGMQQYGVRYIYTMEYGRVVTARAYGRSAAVSTTDAHTARMHAIFGNEGAKVHNIKWYV